MNKQDEFERLIESIPDQKNFQGFLTKGKIIHLDNENAVIDAGLKSEGIVPISVLKEYCNKPNIEVGDEVDVFIDRIENEKGNIVFSVEKAFKEKVWTRLEKAHESTESVEGFIVSFVKAGYAVNIDGIMAFLPKSQIDIKPANEIQEMIDKPYPFKIIKIDRQRNNIVVSRRAVIDEERSGIRGKIIDELYEGKVVEGVVKNITDYGVFVDLGGVDGLLHVVDISWKRINHPSEVLKVGDKINTKVIRFDKNTARISLGIKQLEKDPWKESEGQIKKGDVLDGEVTNVTDYGAFVEIVPGIEGLIYITELSWIQKNAQPLSLLKQSQKIKVKVMDVDMEKRRISLSYKRCMPNPWEQFGIDHPKGSIINGEVRNITEFGLFVNLGEGLDGMVHIPDDDEILKEFRVGQKINVKILDVSSDKERISLGLAGPGEQEKAKA